MARIALINIGMHGHVNPTLGFTRELIRRGHEVYFFSTQEYAAPIAATGATFINYSSITGAASAEHAKIRAQCTAEGVAPPAHISVMSLFLQEFEGTFAELYEAMQSIQPDVMVYDFVSHAAKIIADHLNIPTIKFFTTYASNDHYSLIKETFAKHDYPTLEQIGAAQATIDGLCATFGCPSSSLAQSLGEIHSDNLVFMPRGFQPCGDTFDERFYFVGPCIRDADASVSSTLIPAGDGPVMIISLGSLFHEWPEFYQACFEAFGESRWRIVMAIGSKLDTANLGPIPSNFKIMRHIPQVELLQCADLFISHGGMNSTMESLYYGVPLVVIPQIEEQEVTARRVGETQLGRYLSRSNVSGKVLADAVADVFGNQDIKQNVLDMQRQILASGGSSRAADLIEAKINGRESIPSLSGIKSTAEASPSHLDGDVREP
jgi:MGT family glycosyltransferase